MDFFFKENNNNNNNERVRRNVPIITIDPDLETMNQLSEKILLLENNIRKNDIIIKKLGISKQKCEIAKVDLTPNTNEYNSVKSKWMDYKKQIDVLELKNGRFKIQKMTALMHNNSIRFFRIVK